MTEKHGDSCSEHRSGDTPQVLIALYDRHGVTQPELLPNGQRLA
jgi:hypothetical protein